VSWLFLCSGSFPSRVPPHFPSRVSHISYNRPPDTRTVILIDVFPPNLVSSTESLLTD
jgi:hypothetical protein